MQDAQMRREFIYPHRSIRSFPVSRARFLAAIGLALTLSLLVGNFSPPLLKAHSQISGFILSHMQIPSAGTDNLKVFPILESVVVPVVSLPDNHKKPLRTGLFLAAFTVVVAVIRQKIPLSCNFLIFLMILVGATAIAILVQPSFNLNSIQFQKIWLGGEILVWIVLPWISAFLFILTLPSMWSGAAWTLGTSVYAVLWSALRLPFCLGMLHYTGVLFLPLLWFSLGILFDLVYVLAFYSVALHLSMGKVLGKRVS